MISYLDHVTVCVPSIEAAIQTAGLEAFADLSEIEEFEPDGTRELYIGTPSGGPQLLFIQPTTSEHYKKSIAQRGAGLHHLGLKVKSIPQFLAHARSWRLLPQSLALYNHHKMVWLVRHDVGFLVELMESSQPERKKSADAPINIKALHGSSNFAQWESVKLLNCNELLNDARNSADHPFEIEFNNGHRLNFAVFS